MKQQNVNEISHRGFCRMDKNYMSTFRGASLDTPRLRALKVFTGNFFNQIIREI